MMKMINVSGNDRVTAQVYDKNTVKESGVERGESSDDCRTQTETVWCYTTLYRPFQT